MTIERYSFRPPINVDESSLADLDKVMVFSRKTIVPPDYKLDVTPVGYVDKYILTTKTRAGEIEDTVGEIQRTKGDRPKLEQPVQGFFKKSYTTVGPERTASKIDENMPIAIVAKPSLSPDHKRIASINLGEVIRYTPTGKIVDEEKAKHALYIEFVRILKTPVSVER